MLVVLYGSRQGAASDMAPGSCVPSMGPGWQFGFLARSEADPVRLAWRHVVPWAAQQLECRGRKDCGDTFT